jgi:hypothetical protein
MPRRSPTPKSRSNRPSRRQANRRQACPAAHRRYPAGRRHGIDHPGGVASEPHVFDFVVAAVLLPLGAWLALSTLTGRRARIEALPEAALDCSQHRHDDHARCGEDDPERGCHSRMVSGRVTDGFDDDVRGQDPEAEGDGLLGSPFGGRRRLRRSSIPETPRPASAHTGPPAASAHHGSLARLCSPRSRCQES